MGLLNPLLLLIAAAAAVPLLLHLLQRHQGPRMVFPALRYLRRAEKESARRIRLRQILLMLLRIAAVVLLAFAAARPFVRAGGTGHSPTAVVIILDNSMSTGAVAGEARVLDELKARALEVLADAGVDDRFWLLRAGQPAEAALAGDATATALRVRETEPVAAAANLPAAVAHARAILASGAERRAQEIHLLTDLQANDFRGRAPADSGAPPIVVWHPGTEAPLNRAVTSVEVGGGLAPIAGQRTTVAAALAGAGADAMNVRLAIGDRLIAAASARPGETALLAVPARPPGFLTGRVEIDADALRADDSRFFAARVLPPPGVVVAGAQPFIDDALEVLAEAGRVRNGAVNPDVAILDAGRGVESYGIGTALVILPPAAPSELAAVNRRLAGAGIPWRYEAPVAGEARFAPEQADPLLRGLSDARVRVVYPLARTSDGGADSVLIRLSDGGAWGVRGTRAVGGTYVLLGSPLSAEASTLPTSALMVPLLDRITAAWARALPPNTNAAPGDEVGLPSGITSVARPDGTREDVAGATSYRFGAEPGIYQLIRGDSVMAAYAVNPPAGESDLTRLAERELDAHLPGWTLHVTDNAGAWRRAAFRERLGHELWRPLLLALLLVLVIESLAAAAGRARRVGTRMAEADAG
ncbi:MAG TPA: BatA domain-containing protein [Longimicrobiales bacterium]